MDHATDGGDVIVGIILVISFLMILITSLIIADVIDINTITTTSGVNVNTVNNGSWFSITILSLSLAIFVGCVLYLTLSIFDRKIFSYSEKNEKVSTSSGSLSGPLEPLQPIKNTVSTSSNSDIELVEL